VAGPSIKLAIEVLREKHRSAIAHHHEQICLHNTLLNRRIVYLQSQCPHEDNGGFMHGFCKWCGKS
jgi:hypothetical protein